MKKVTIGCDKKIHPYRFASIGSLFISLLFVVAMTSFAYAAGEHDHPHDHEQQLELGRLIIPMGITTLSLLVLTAAGRLFRKKVPKFLVRWHKRLGIITLVSASTHAILVLIAH